MLREERVPDIRLQLLDAQRQTAVLRLNAQNDRANLLALLQDLRGMLNALGPAEVRDVHQAVDAIFDFAEGPKVGQVANAAFNDRAGRVLVPLPQGFS
jgi:hypothetical protein